MPVWVHLGLVPYRPGPQELEASLAGPPHCRLGTLATAGLVPVHTASSGPWALPVLQRGPLLCTQAHPFCLTSCWAVAVAPAAVLVCKPLGLRVRRLPCTVWTRNLCATAARQ